MAALVAACALAYPADAAAESALEYAVFDRQAGTLELVFDAPPVYGNLTLRPDGAGTFLAYDVDAERRNVLALDAVALEQFRNIVCPTLHVGAGSFVDADGASIGSHSVPLWVVPGDGWMPPRPGVDVSCTLTYRIVESPLTPSGDLLDAVHDGMEAWSELNPGLELRHVEVGRANISIEFAEIGPPNVGGEACTDCVYTYATEPVIQGCAGNEGDPNEGAKIRLNVSITEYDVLRDTVAHEFGHNLGLCHTCSTDIVMGVDASDYQIPYKDLGYDVPKPVSGGTNVVANFCGVAEVFGYLQDEPEIHNWMDVVIMAIIVIVMIIGLVGIVVVVWYKVRRARIAL